MAFTNKLKMVPLAVLFGLALLALPGCSDSGKDALGADSESPMDLTTDEKGREDLRQDLLFDGAD